MARQRKPTPLDVFEDNIADAERLLQLTRILLNTRKRRMRRELRETVGDAIKVGRRDQDGLDCVESLDVFVVLKPDGVARREHFTDAQLRPLLRQAIVALSAAVESYISVKACTYIGSALDASPPPPRLHQIALRFGDVIWIEDNYERRRWGQRRILEDHIEREASPAPEKIGELMATVGAWTGKPWKRVDNRRKVVAGTSEQQLRGLYKRRNRIAHAGDRVGAGRAFLTPDEVQEHLDNAKSIIEALDAEL